MGNVAHAEKHGILDHVTVSQPMVLSQVFIIRALRLMSSLMMSSKMAAFSNSICVNITNTQCQSQMSVLKKSH